MAATVSQTCLLGFPHPGPVQATTGAHPDTGHHFRTASPSPARGADQPVASVLQHESLHVPALLSPYTRTPQP